RQQRQLTKGEVGTLRQKLQKLLADCAGRPGHGHIVPPAHTVTPSAPKVVALARECGESLCGTLRRWRWGNLPALDETVSCSRDCIIAAVLWGGGGEGDHRSGLPLPSPASGRGLPRITPPPTTRLAGTRPPLVARSSLGKGAFAARRLQSRGVGRKGAG